MYEIKTKNLFDNLSLKKINPNFFFYAMHSFYVTSVHENNKLNGL